jgi:hypothetical protein
VLKKPREATLTLIFLVVFMTVDHTYFYKDSLLFLLIGRFTVFMRSCLLLLTGQKCAQF